MIVIAGGGVAGIVAAILLAEKSEPVCLIEKSEKIGGLYLSKQNDLGVAFDYGGHFIQSTGISEIDNIILDGVDNNKWHTFNNLKGGNFYGSELNTKSPFLDTRQLPVDIYRKGILELLAIKDTMKQPENLHEQIISIFGDTFTNHVFKPILEDKFFGHKLADLSVNSHLLFGFNRVIGFDSNTAREIKKSEVFDQKIAFNSYNEGASELSNFYPKNGGIELFIKNLHRKLKSLNVTVLTGVEISEISHQDNKVNSISLDNGNKLDCSSIIWTIAPPLFGKYCNIKSEVKSEKPQQLYTYLHDFAFDQDFLVDTHYIQCHEPTLDTFRTTLYSNIQENNQRVFHLTSEILSPKKLNIEESRAKAIQELVSMGIITPESKILFQNSELLENGFPIPTLKSINSSSSVVEFFESNIENVVFLGRALGNGFTLGSILNDIYKKIY